MKPWLATACLSLAACGGRGATDAGADAGEFVATEQDFAGFQGWNAYDLGEGATDGVHATGDRWGYLNQKPPHGSPSFPVGTLIVKTVFYDNDAGEDVNAFAMSKRGGDFNADSGMTGWEWLELQLDGDGGFASFVWRGTRPPPGQSYGFVGGDPCNVCHRHASNDGVYAPQLDLSTF